jgi:hypothetical protein
MLDNLHLSLFLNLLGLGLEVIGFGWILIKERRYNDQQPSLLLRPTLHLDDIESPIIKLEDLERQAADNEDNRMSAPITVTYSSDKILGTKGMGIRLIALGFFIQIGTLFF